MRKVLEALTDSQMAFYQANLKGKPIGKLKKTLEDGVWSQKISMGDAIHIAFVLGGYIATQAGNTRQGEVV